MIDHNFPVITYEKNQSPHQWGLAHGETFKAGISELAQIRKELMLKKNPALKDKINELAEIQFLESKKLAPALCEELSAIAKGASISLTDIVILNNYTDFRDIQLPDEGCSSLHIQQADNAIAGQTWDMHQSAKNYISIINIPESESSPSMLLFSLVGCLGMMGINQHGTLVGVNNVNTLKATAGVIWPLLVRHALAQETFDDTVEALISSKVTSGHNYLVSNISQAKNIEVTPTIYQVVSEANKNQTAPIFHANHCLGNKIIPLEDKSSISSTTHKRQLLLEKKINQVTNFEEVKGLLMDHEGHPMSICSHYESGAQDPAFTCGGGLADFKNNNFYFWRGCQTYDDNFVEHSFSLTENEFCPQT